MKELEESLGFSLINRSTHGVVLTDAGEELFQHALRCSPSWTIRQERRNIETGPFGTLRVQATGDYARFVLAPLTIKFAKKRPGVRVHLSVVSDNSVPAEDGYDVIVSSQKPSLPASSLSIWHRPARDLRIARLFSEIRPAESAAGTS